AGPSSGMLVALRRILRPLVHILIREGVTFPTLSGVLKAVYVDVADRFFALAECAQLVGLDAAAEKEALFAFWTLKEAYIKAVGMGLALPLGAFAYTLDPLSIAFDERIQDDPASWYFQRLRPTEGHVLALALRHEAPSRATLDAAPADLAALLRLAG
ncbi:MAG: DUF6502 family protein, partial [Oceanibaculum sp.]